MNRFIKGLKLIGTASDLLEIPKPLQRAETRYHLVVKYPI